MEGSTFFELVGNADVLILVSYLSIFRFCPSYDFGDISANDLWTLFSTTIEGLFDVEANLEIFEPKDYVTLLFSVSTTVFVSSTTY